MLTIEEHIGTFKASKYSKTYSGGIETKRILYKNVEY